jgi:hypothetical protein
MQESLTPNVVEALDTTKARVIELETTLETIKDAMEIDLRKDILET